MKCYNREGVHIKVNCVYLVFYLIAPANESSDTGRCKYESQYEYKNGAGECVRRLQTCLAICEDAGVVPKEGVVQQTLSETLEHDVLALKSKEKKIYEMKTPSW